MKSGASGLSCLVDLAGVSCDVGGEAASGVLPLFAGAETGEGDASAIGEKRKKERRREGQPAGRGWGESASSWRTCTSRAGVIPLLA